MPKDPVMLLSYINTQLRDSYSSLEDFCKGECADQKEIEQKLGGIDYQYDAGVNQFV